jgi:hypothetical protein
MKKNIVVLLAAVGIALAAGGGGGYILLQRTANARLDNAVEQIRASLPSEAKLQIGRRSADIWDHRAELADIVLECAEGMLAIASIELDGLSGENLDTVRTDRIAIRDLRFRDPAPKTAGMAVGYA